MIRNNRGFTLIELLVAIAIIGILSSIVLINVNEAKDKAKKAAAIQSLGQITLAMQLYYNEHGQWPNMQCWGEYCSAYFDGNWNEGVPDFVPEYYPNWDASWYCPDCNYIFGIDSTNWGEGTPDCGYVAIADSGWSTYIYKYTICEKADSCNWGYDYCGYTNYWPQ